MNISFNLLEQGWIACVPREGGPPRELGLREALLRAHELREISDPSPLATIALHRLLLAVLHRVFGPKGADAWDDLWQRGCWDAARLDGYLDQWRDRFNLFDEQRPFYQAASLKFEYEKPIATLAHELASGNNTTLFDHTTEVAPPVFTPAQAARYLVAYQAFAMGGLVSLEKGQDPKLYKSADAAPLVKGAVALVQGATLFETLALNLHRYDAARGTPFEGTGTDCPAWERDGETQAGDRWPAGYLDLLTWQSRRIRLHPASDEAGRVVVPGVVIMKGAQFPDGCTRHGRETMLAFGRNLKAKGVQDPFPVVGFVEDRAMWRDSLALFQSVHDEHERPMTLDWLHDLCQEGPLTRAQTLPLHLYGLCPDQANVLFWRHESLPLPLVYLDDVDLRGTLKTALEWAEQAGRDLNTGMWWLAKLLLAPDSDDAEARQPLRKDVDDLARSLTSSHLYWASLDAPFKAFLTDLATAALADAGGDNGDDGSGDFGADAQREWRDKIRQAAIAAFAETTRGLDSSARALKAVAIAGRRLGGLLREHLGDGPQHGDTVAGSPAPASAGTHGLDDETEGGLS